MRTQFVSVIRSRSFRLRATIWTGVAAVFFLTVVAGSLVWLSGHHLVRTGKGLVVVPKRFVSLSGTCADICGWKWEDAVARHELSRALIKAGYSDLLPQPPPDPTVMERAPEKARQLRAEFVLASSNAWQRVKAKTAEWKEGIEKKKSNDGGQKPE